MTTLWLHPASSFVMVVKTPVESMASLTPASPSWLLLGSRSRKIEMILLLLLHFLLSAPTVPRIESYWNV